MTAVPVKDETHGGDDVPLYARGTMAHLFYGVQEQNYIPHALAYASCVARRTSATAGTGKARIKR